MTFLGYASGHTDRRTDKHTNRHTDTLIATLGPPDAVEAISGFDGVTVATIVMRACTRVHVYVITTV